jgi:large conductance mechanosensitive channel
MLKEFKAFISRGNVLDLAVAVIIGAAFGKIVTTLVESVLMPPMGLLLGKVDFSSLFVMLDHSKVPAGVPISLKQAKDAGIPVIAYGQLLNDVITFLIVAFAVFVVVKQANRFKPQEAPAPVVPMKECPFCGSSILAKAKRCPQCTSTL